MLNILVGIGLPCAGKTTYLQPLVEEYGAVYISPDDIREALTGNRTDRTADKQVWLEVHAAIMGAIENGYSVVLDTTMIKAYNRRQLIEQLRNYGAQFGQELYIKGIFLDADVWVCSHRQARVRKPNPASLRRMHDRLIRRRPSIKEGFNEVEVVPVEAP